MYASIASQRALIWISIILLSVFGVGLMVFMKFFPPPPASLDAASVALLYSTHNLQFRIGVIICLVTGGFLLPWSVVIGVQMARLEKGIPIWAILQALAGAVGTVVLWLPALQWGTAAFNVSRDPALTLMMHEFGWLTLITPLSLFPIQLAAIAVVCFTKDERDEHSAFPRWIGYLTIWLFVQSLGGPIAELFTEGLFAWHGLFAFYLPFTLFFIWIVALAYTMLRALRHQSKGPV